MPRSSGSRKQPLATTPSDATLDRRGNPELRMLIDDMLKRVRELNRNARVLDDADYARAEAELEAAMARVRRAATQRAKE